MADRYSYEPNIFKHIYRRAHRVLAKCKDVIAHAICVVDYDHHEVHEGDAYYLVASVEESTAGEGVRISFRTPAVSDPQKHCHLTYSAQSFGGEAIFNIFEDVTSVSGGTSRVPFNQHRGSANASSVTAPLVGSEATFDGITVTGGTSIVTPSGITIGDGKTSGGDHRGTQERILKPDSLYVFELLNNYANASGTILNLELNWYEHTDSVEWT